MAPSSLRVFIDCCTLLKFNGFHFSHVLSLKFHSHCCCYHLVQGVDIQASDTGKSGKTNWLLCVAARLNGLTMGHLVRKAELEPSSAAETLQLELPLPLSSLPHHPLSPRWNKHCSFHHPSITTHPFLHVWVKERALVSSLLPAGIPYFEVTNWQEWRVHVCLFSCVCLHGGGGKWG